MPLASNMRRQVLMTGPWVSREEGVIRASCIAVLDLKKKGLPGGQAFMEPGTNVDHVRLLPSAGQRISGSPAVHRSLNGRQVHTQTGRQAFDQGPNARAVAGAKEGGRHHLAEAHPHEAQQRLVGRCLQPLRWDRAGSANEGCSQEASVGGTLLIPRFKALNRRLGTAWNDDDDGRSRA